MKRLTLPLVLALSVMVALVAPSGIASAKAKKAAGPMVVGSDVVGDWGVNVDPTIAPVGNALGQDLVGASIGMADPKTVNFVIKVNALPPSGGVPEVSRYNWDFTVNGEAFQLTGGFTEYLRGICNPTTPGTCPPPRDPGSSPFFLRQGACLVGTTIDCTELALLHATFDSAAGTVTIPVPTDVIKAKPGAKIGPGASSLGMTIYCATAAFITNASLPNDQMMVTGTYVIPR
jgi:hypothetical protein